MTFNLVSGVFLIKDKILGFVVRTVVAGDPTVTAY